MNRGRSPASPKRRFRLAGALGIYKINMPLLLKRKKNLPFPCRKKGRLPEAENGQTG